MNRGVRCIKNENHIIAVTALIVITLNVYAMLRVSRKNNLEKFQKITQSAIIWVVPIIGALFILSFIKEDETPKGPYNPNDGQGNDSMPGGVQ